MRDRYWLLLLVAVACGRELGSAPSSGDGGTPTDASPAEAKVTTFPCGSTLCNFGIHACCFSSAGPACVDIARGCPADGDAGTDAASGPPLLCGTYNNCDGGDDCCFNPDAGSRCESSCDGNDQNLCRIGQDSCNDGECVEFAESPAPGTTGRCKSD